MLNTATVNTLRFLSADAVQAAGSGHPGLPLGAAPMALALFAAMKHNPANPAWRARDRFVMSAGHGSALLYSLLHVFGYDVSLEDLKNFRQMHSKTAGHPEYGHTPGVEVTTGPLGQGIANAVGFAWAQSHLAAIFNKKDAQIVDNFTFALCGDGCLQEGVAYEAISLAGTLKLNKLIVLYDSNNITIEGSTDLAFTENVGERFTACGWHVQKVTDGNDLQAITQAIESAKSSDKPSLIEVKTIIGYSAPKQGTAGVHGSPLGAEGIAHAKKFLSWQHEGSFHVPQAVYDAAAVWQAAAAEAEAAWNATLTHYREAYPDAYKQYLQWHSQDLPVDLDTWADFWVYEGNLATRQSSEVVLNKLATRIPNLFGGSADLHPSTLSVMDGRGFYSPERPCGSNLHFGIREHAMAAIANAFALYGGLRPYVAGFFVFADYMKPAMRLAALMNLPIIYILTHDSIGVGEDGPTHQPIEQLAMLRSIPGFTVFRPCDTHETAAAWAHAMRAAGPTALVLSRQPLPLLPETGKAALRGGYVLLDNTNPATGAPDILLMASGSEVALIYEATAFLLQEGIHARVISMPSMELFDALPCQEKEAVLPRAVRARLAVEAASGGCWHKYVGLDGAVMGMGTFGASAPAAQLFTAYGFTVEAVVAKAKEVLK